MKFLVVWWIINTVAAPCPDYRPDPYTGEYPSTMCAVYHTRQVEEKMERIFETRKEADEFIKKAPAEIQPKMHIILMVPSGRPKGAKNG